MAHIWQPRNPDRLPDAEWHTTLGRVRAEFEEMPGLRITPAQARVLFGLSDAILDPVLNRLAGDGFLEQRNGEYIRRNAEP